MDIRRKHLSVSSSGEFSMDQREDALRCVLYEMVVLAMALLQLKKKSEKMKVRSSGESLPFGQEQTAHEAASMTCRVLIEFLYPKRQGKKGSSAPKDLRTFNDSLNKWAFHLTWKRVKKSKDYLQSYPAELLKRGPEVLEEARIFVEDCVKKYHYKLTSPNAAAYYDKFLELYSKVKRLGK